VNPEINGPILGANAPMCAQPPAFANRGTGSLGAPFGMAFHDGYLYVGNTASLIRYKYTSGRELDWFITGFSPRKSDLTLYIMPGAERFKKLTDELGKQYASYEAAPGVFINGSLTMGENIGDMSGLEVAYSAYKMSLNGQEAPVIDGLTGDQRFFLAFAQAWRGKQREDAIKTQVASDPHSPRRFRIIGPLRNLDAWYDAFKIGPDSKFYIPPAQRVRIW